MKNTDQAEFDAEWFHHIPSYMSFVDFGQAYEEADVKKRVRLIAVLYTRTKPGAPASMNYNKDKENHI